MSTLLKTVLDRLEEERRVAEKDESFEHLRIYLLGDTGLPTYAEMGARLGQTEGSVRVAVHRLRTRYRELLQEEILRTVASPDDLAEELRSLLALFAD